MLFSKGNNSLKGKVAIVTGGGRGIGKSIALLLADYECKVVIFSRTEKELKETEKEIKQKNVDVLALRADVSKLNDVKRVINGTIKKFVKINILVNNAGIAVYKSLSETNSNEIDNTIDINLKGLIHFTKESLPYIEKENYGRIVNISSGLGKFGMANFAVYCATKFGVIGFTEAIAEELKNNVKAYTVCTGGTDTKMYPGTNRAFLDKPEKVAKVVLKVCMPDCRIKNGATVDV